MSWQMPTSGQWNPGGIAQPGVMGTMITPDMQSNYTPEQWTMMQQQNWHQWTQWQQQYAQWQNQYGEKYAQQMQAIQQMGGMAPMPSNAPPPAPPPPDKPPPPPPPHENDQPLYANSQGQPVPVPAPATPNRTLTSVPAAATAARYPPPQTNYENNIGNNQQRSYGAELRAESHSQQPKQPQQPPSQVDAEALKNLAEEERLFDIQFKKWEEEIEKWKSENVNHPDREAYNQYEQKFESCRANLLERRKAMNLRRAKLLGTSTQTSASPSVNKSNIPADNTAVKTTSQVPPAPNHKEGYPAHQHQQNYYNNSPQYLKQDAQNRQYDNQSAYNQGNDNQGSIRQKIYDEYQDMGNMDDYNTNNSSSFLPSSATSKGIPGLDLVPEVEKPQTPQPDVIDITQDDPKVAISGPDYNTISKGINNILGDEKIMNILNMVANAHSGQGQGALIQNNNSNQNNQWPENRNSRGLNNQFSNQQSWVPNNINQNNQGPRIPMQQNQGYPMQQNQGQGPGMRRSLLGLPNQPNQGPGYPNQQNSNAGRPNMHNQGPGGPNMQNQGPGRPNMQNQGPGGPFMQNQGPGRPNMQNQGSGGPNMQNQGPSGPNVQNQGSGRPNMQNQGPGGPNMQNQGPGGQNMQNQGPGGQNVQYQGPGRLNMQNQGPGGPNIQNQGSRGFNMQNQGPGGPNTQIQGMRGHNMQSHGPGGPNTQNQGMRGQHQDSGPNMQGQGLNRLTQQGYPQQGPPRNMLNNRQGDMGQQSHNQYYDDNNSLYEDNSNQGFPNRGPQRPNPPIRPLIPNLPGQQKINDFSNAPNNMPYQQENIPPATVAPPKPKWAEDPLFTPSIIVEYEHKPLRLKARDFIEPVHMFNYNHKSKDEEGKSKDFSKEFDEELFSKRPPRREDEIFDRRRHPLDRLGRDREPPSRDFERRPRLDDLDRRPREDLAYERRPREDLRDDWKPRAPLRDNFDDRRRLDDRLDDRRRDDRDRYSRRENDRDRDRERDRGRDRDDRHRRDDNRSRDRDSESRKRGTSSENDQSAAKKPKSKSSIVPEAKHVVMIDDLLEPPGRHMRPEKLVIILRGPPGSGKSYLAKLIRDKEAEYGSTARIMSIDDYFVQEVEIEEKDPATGKIVKKPSSKYEYEEKLEETYLNSLKRAFKRSLTDGYFPFLIFDAVNDQLKSYADVWNFARQNGFQVYICTMEIDAQACFKRNIHNRTLEDIEVICARFFDTPSHHIQLDATTLLQSAAITEVDMEDADDDVIMEDQEPEVTTSKWEKMDDVNQLARLDGTSKPLRSSHLSMEDYLQLDDWQPTKAQPGKKTVRWADIEERREQEKMRAIGFVVGQTDWNRMTDPTMGSSALTQTKYIERVRRT